MSSELQTYYIKCGNWCCRVSIDASGYTDVNQLYFEVATRAMEYVYGDKEYEGEDALIAVYNKKGKNVIGTLSEVDQFLDVAFTIDTEIYSAYDVNSKNTETDLLKQVLLTSEVFSNAAMHDLAEAARQQEEDEL